MTPEPSDVSPAKLAAADQKYAELREALDVLVKQAAGFLALGASPMEATMRVLGGLHAGREHFGDGVVVHLAKLLATACVQLADQGQRPASQSKTSPNQQ
jgi:hypothetical protein